ncbi:MAG TPA: DUF3307 domain-containing protein [Bacteroidales bacterium]|jgi:hypothetical protein|nr:DUF3307 domain-containing protein [Bacteroidales bacterium]
MIILVKLLLAHFTGDFLLQPDSWVKAKETRRLASWQLYLHSLLHFALIMLLILNVDFILPALIISLLHLLTDIVKVFFQSAGKKRQLFFADQMVHLMVILIVWSLYTRELLSLDIRTFNFCLTLLTFIYILTQPASIFIRIFISRWSPDSDSSIGSLEKAGNWIGILERLFVFTFVFAGQWEAVGFLLAAKSIFRFGDLKESKDRKLTEYVLIGTLISFGIAILSGIVFYKITSDGI